MKDLTPVIVSARRTPFGKRGGGLSGLPIPRFPDMLWSPRPFGVGLVG